MTRGTVFLIVVLFAAVVCPGCMLCWSSLMGELEAVMAALGAGSSATGVGLYSGLGGFHPQSAFQLCRARLHLLRRIGSAIIRDLDWRLLLQPEGHKVRRYKHFKMNWEAA